MHINVYSYMYVYIYIYANMIVYAYAYMTLCICICMYEISYTYELAFEMPSSILNDSSCGLLADFVKGWPPGSPLSFLKDVLVTPKGI